MGARVALLLSVIATFPLESASLCAQDTAPKGSRSEREGQIAEVKALFAAALEFEDSHEYELALGKYEQVKALFPKKAATYYRMGVCHQTLGHKDAAILAFKEYLSLETVLTAADAADARARVVELILPVLSASQRDSYEEAVECINVAAEIGTELGVDAEPGRRERALKQAITLLGQLQVEVSEYLPLYGLLGAAHEALDQRHEAYVSYKRYIDGYNALQIRPGDYDDIRQRKIKCEFYYQKYRDEQAKALIEQAAAAATAGNWQAAIQHVRSAQPFADSKRRDELDALIVQFSQNWRDKVTRDGDVAMSRNEPAVASGHFRAARDILDDNAATRAKLAFALFLQSEQAQGERQLQAERLQAFEVVADDPEAKRMLYKLLSRAGEAKAAEQEWSKAEDTYRFALQSADDPADMNARLYHVCLVQGDAALEEGNRAQAGMHFKNAKEFTKAPADIDERIECALSGMSLKHLARLLTYCALIQGTSDTALPEQEGLLRKQLNLMWREIDPTRLPGALEADTMELVRIQCGAGWLKRYFAGASPFTSGDRRRIYDRFLGEGVEARRADAFESAVTAFRKALVYSVGDKESREARQQLYGIMLQQGDSAIGDYDFGSAAAYYAKAREWGSVDPSVEERLALLEKGVDLDVVASLMRYAVSGVHGANRAKSLDFTANREVLGIRLGELRRELGIQDDVKAPESDEELGRGTFRMLRAVYGANWFGGWIDTHNKTEGAVK